MLGRGRRTSWATKDGRPNPLRWRFVRRTGLSPSVREKVAWANHPLAGQTGHSPGPRRATTSAFSMPTSIRVLGPGDARPFGTARRRWRPGDPFLTAFGLNVMSMGFFVEERPARHMAGADAPQSARTVPRRCRLGQPRLPSWWTCRPGPATWPCRCRSTCPAPRSTWSRRLARGQEGGAAQRLHGPQDRTCPCGASSRT